ncbi:MAG: FHA domain-containing protein [Lachnospiraceae bacterium]|nr:FHA domain-containing protein [Lachnospiraceae bacterium]
MKQKETRYLTGAVHVLNGTYKDAVLVLQPGEELVIGRDVNVCQLILEAPWVSRRHCIIAYNRETGFYDVTDVSENGTFAMDAERLPKGERTQLESGTVLVIGTDGIRILLL